MSDFPRPIVPRLPDENRYARMAYKRCGRSGLLLPKISLGIWQNFGDYHSESVARDIVLRAFDSGITHFDAANNYGPPHGAAEERFGRILKQNLAAYRDEMVISTKAGYRMWPGPYGDCGSRKYLLTSLDQSLRRLQLDYVDIFYSHRPDPETPLEETMGALAQAVRSGKALYAGISNYPPEQTQAAAALLRQMGTPCLIHQTKISLLYPENTELFPVLKKEGVGCIVFSPLAQGLLSERYLNGIPANSRVAQNFARSIDRAELEGALPKIRAFAQLAQARGETLPRMALAWLLAQEAVTSVLPGASSVAQLEEILKCLDSAPFSAEEMKAIAQIQSGGDFLPHYGKSPA